MDIIVFCIFFHSFHILQLFDVKCFGLLKAAYGKEIKKMIQMHLTHIIKDNFFFTFKQVFFVSMGEKNVQARFQVINFMPYNPEIVINSLNFRLKIFTLSNSHLTSIASTNLTTFKTAKDAVRSFIELLFKIVTHQNNSLNQLYNLIDVQIKSISTLMYQMILFEIKIKNFHTINEILNKHHKIKKIWLWTERSLNVFEANVLWSQKVFVQAGNSDMCERNACTKPNELCVWHCGNCNQFGHNVWICQIDSSSSKEKDNM